MGTRSKRFFALSLTLSLSACSLFGGGNKYEQYNPPEGSVERRVNKSPEEITKATTETLAELGMTTTAEQHDALGGRITAQRATPDKEEVIIWYKSVDTRNTAIAVKVGNGDKSLADLIQYRIAQHLGSALAQTVPSIGAVAEALYDQPVPQATVAMESALKSMSVKVTSRDIHDTWTMINCREADAIPIDIKLERTEKDKTRVRIVAGTNQSQDNQQLADRVKTVFEEKLQQTPTNAAPKSE